MSKRRATRASVPAMTHAQLVERARGWLQRQGCQVVLCEFTLDEYGEIPDAFGLNFEIGFDWSGGRRDELLSIRARSILIECKASRADFLRDARKPHRQLTDALKTPAASGRQQTPVPGVPPLGDQRYYLTPRGLLDQAEIPGGWGLLEATARQIRKVVDAPGCLHGRTDIARRDQREIAMIFRACHRYQLDPRIAGGDPLTLREKAAHESQASQPQTPSL